MTEKAATTRAQGGKAAILLADCAFAYRARLPIGGAWLGAPAHPRTYAQSSRSGLALLKACATSISATQKRFRTLLTASAPHLSRLLRITSDSEKRFEKPLYENSAGRSRTCFTYFDGPTSRLPDSDSVRSRVQYLPSAAEKD